MLLRRSVCLKQSIYVTIKINHTMEVLQVNKIRTQEELERAFAVRRKVFVEEQGCPPELEYENEDVSTHFLALMDNQPCGACRWRKTDKGYKLERFAVLKEFRNK